MTSLILSKYNFHRHKTLDLSVNNLKLHKSHSCTVCIANKRMYANVVHTSYMTSVYIVDIVVRMSHAYINKPQATGQAP